MYIIVLCHRSTPGLQSEPKGGCPPTATRAWVQLENEQIPDVEYKIVFHAMQCPFAFWWCLHVFEYCKYPDFDRLVPLGPAPCSVPSRGMYMLCSHIWL